MEEDIHENNYEQCEFCETIYWENDTGYREFGCSLITGEAVDSECLGGDIENGCPLSFKYSVEKNESLISGGKK